MRGLPNVAAEWTLLATAFNLSALRPIWRARMPDPEFTNESQRQISALPRDTDRSPFRNGVKLPACVLRAIVPAGPISIFQRVRLAPMRLDLSPDRFRDKLLVGTPTSCVLGTECRVSIRVCSANYRARWLDAGGVAEDYFESVEVESLAVVAPDHGELHFFAGGMNA